MLITARERTQKGCIVQKQCMEPKIRAKAVVGQEHCSMRVIIGAALSTKQEQENQSMLFLQMHESQV
jgi:hypothetical protein